MSTPVILAILVCAAILEAGGDALIRAGLGHAGWTRAAALALGAALLFAYGYAVNSPPWDFGRLLGVYIVLFFLIAQLLNWLAFHHKPGPGVMAGGSLILAGGLIVALWRA